MQLEDLTVTYDISTVDPLSLVAQVCNLAQITPVRLEFNDKQERCELSTNDAAVR